MQNIFQTAMNHGVTGIIPALAAHDNVRRAREDIDDLALSLVAPLRTDQNCVRHLFRRLAGKKKFPDASGKTQSGLADER